MEKLIILLMQSRTLIHILHLRSQSYARHMALGALYDSLNGHIDALAENNQGETQSLLELNTLPGFNTAGDALSHLIDINQEISNMRLSFNSSVTQNLIDTLQQDFNSAIYKLKFLK